MHNSFKLPNFKIVVFATTILCNSHILASSNINRIVIEGNKRVEAKTIENYLGLKVGDSYDQYRQNEAIKSLYSTSLFENISIRFLDGGNLVIKVEETPFISKIEFKGNSKIKSSTISREILTVAGESLSKANIQADIEKIKEMYKRSGRFSAIVSASVQEQENNRVKVIFDISEGPKTSVKKIYFAGNHSYRDNELKSIVMTKESRWYSFLETNDTYDPDRIDYDKEMLREFYQSVGFVDFRVISATAELSTTKEYFTVTYSIEEGYRYNFGQISVNNKLVEIDTGVAEKLINIKKGELFNMSALDKIAQKISATLASLGYPQVNVEPVVSNKDPINRTADVVFVIDKADKVFINQINIEGNTKTEDKVIRRELRIAEGDVFNRSYIEKGEHNLRNLDFFEKISTKITPTNQRDRYDVNIAVQEKSTSSIGFDLGYNTASGLFGRLSFIERNLIGTGKLLSAGVQMGKKNTSYYAGITEPHFLDKDLSLGLNVFNNYSGRGGGWSEAEQNYTIKTIGATTSLGYDIYEDLSHEIDYTIKQDDLRALANNSNSRFLSEQVGKTVTSAVAHTITYDQTDSRIIPKNGYMVSGTQEYAGLGGSNKYLKHEADGKYFKSFINNKLTLKLSGSVGNITGVGGKSVKISDRFNLGDYSLRGFSSGGVGPRDKKTEEGLGGQNFYSVSTELTFPLPKVPDDFNLSGAVFADAGSVWGIKLNSKSKYRREEFYDEKSMRASIGCGLIWITRVAPIRIDWAFPIRKKKYDDKQNIHIKFTTNF